MFLRADRFGRGGNPRLDWRPPPPGFHARSRRFGWAAIAVGISVRDFIKPYKDPCFQRDRDFALLVLDGRNPATASWSV